MLRRAGWLGGSYILAAQKRWGRRHPTARLAGAVLLAAIAACLSCSALPDDDGSGDDGSDDVVERPEGWTEATHSKGAAPDYEVVFPEGAVGRIDLTIAPADWQAMLDDMTSLYGAFGQGGGGDIPVGGDGAWADLRAACVDRAEGDACTVSINGVEIAATCVPAPDGQLACGVQGGVPGGPGDIPSNGAPPGGAGDFNSNAALPGLSEACDGRAVGDACTVAFIGVEMAGTCAESDDDGLVCQAGAGVTPGGNGGIGLATEDNPIYVPCTLSFAGRTWWYVGVRFKGQSSLMSTWSEGIYKLPLRLDFDQFEDEHPEIDNQRFHGFKELSLASNWSDSSYLREKVAHDIFREAGVPAPRTAFYRVFVDHGAGAVYLGLYTVTEIPGEPMLTAQFGDPAGNLYKPTSNWVEFAEDDFDKETNEDEEDYSDVQAALTALHADRTDAAAWRAGLEAAVNVDAFLRWLAVNTVIQNWDTYGNMAQNYYLYGDPDDGGRLNWIPWDNNMALGSGAQAGGAAGGSAGNGGGGMGALSLSLAEVSAQWPLIRYLADDAEYWSRYVAFVEEVSAGAFTVEATQARYQAAHDLIAPYVVGVEGEQAGYTFIEDAQEFENGLNDLREHVVQRRTAVLEFLADTGISE